MFYVCRSVVCPSIDTYFAWRDIFVLNGRISMKLGTHIQHMSGHCWTGFQGRAPLYLRTLWRYTNAVIIIIKGRGHAATTTKILWFCELDSAWCAKGIWTKIYTNTDYIRETNILDFQGHGVKGQGYVYKCVSATMMEENSSTMWRRGSPVLLYTFFFRKIK